MAKNKQNNKQPLNQKVTDERLGSVLATLEKRQKEGTLGPNEKRRLQDLRAKSGTMPQPGVVTPNIDATANINPDGSFNNPQDALDEAGTTFDPNDPYWQDLYKRNYDNTYGLATAGLEERKAREMEDARQIAAERGLPFDPGNRESAYGKQIGGVNDRYDDLYSQASGQAYQAAESAYTAQGGLANQGFVSYLESTLGLSEAQARAKALELQRYGTDKDYKAKMAAVAKSGSGGSSGGSGGGSTGGGFEILG
jgi:hypothetical protein